MAIRLPKADRVIIAVKPETVKVFKRFAEAAGISLARAMGGWCDETVAGVPVITRMVSQARGAPRVVMADLLDRARQHDADFAASPEGQAEAHASRDADAVAAWHASQPAAARPAQTAAPRRAVVSPLRPTPPRPVIRGDSVPHRGRDNGKR